MICSCPKCNATIELDHAQIPEEGVATNCAFCNVHIQFVRESFAKMAYYKAAQKSCFRCGNHLGHTLDCPFCHALYPDFFVAVDSSAVRRQTRERNRQHLIASFKGFKLSLPNFKASAAQKSHLKSIPQPVIGKQSAFGKIHLSRNMLVALVSLLLIAIIGSGGYTVYARQKAEQTYLEIFFKALYGIKSGADLSTKTHTKYVKELTSAQSSGLRMLPRATSDEEMRLTKVKTEVDKLIQQLNPPAEKFAKPYENLGKLNEQYGRLHALAISPPASLPALNEAIKTHGDSFSRQSKELKSSFTEEMADELKNAKQRYTILKDF